MDKRILEQYESLKRETQELTDRINELDSLQKALNEKKDIRILKDRRARANECVVEIDDFISHMDDSRMRRMIEYRFLQNMPWCKVAIEMGQQYTEESCREGACRSYKEKERGKTLFDKPVESKATIEKGDKIHIKKGAKDINTNGTYASWVYEPTYIVHSVKNGEVVFGTGAVVVGKTKKSNCTIV